MSEQNTNNNNELQITYKDKQQTSQKSKFPREKVFLVNENYTNIKNISDIYADLLYSAYCKQKTKSV